MISVKKDFNNIPDILLSDKKEAWRDKSVLNELKKLYHGKCAYCEQKSETLYIDHYRPPNKYLWLKNEWSNLLPVCSECDKAKKDSFPLNGKQITIPPRNKKDYHANSKYLLSEQPLILHPEVDTVENHFYFEKNGVIQGFTEKGRKTISALNLYRDFLTNEKDKIYKTYFAKLKEKIIEVKNHDDFFEKIIEISNNKNEFSLFGKQLCYQFENFLYKEVISEIENIKHKLYKKKYEDALNSGMPEQDIEGLETYELDAEIVLAEYFRIIFNVEYKYELKLKLINLLSIKSFSIKNFQGIKEISLNNIPLNTQWIFLTGENGFGKTSIIKALLLGLIGKSEFKETEINENTRIALTIVEREKKLLDERDKIKHNIFGSHIFHGFKTQIAAYGAIRTFLNPTSEKVPTSANLFTSKKLENIYVLNTEALIERLDGKPELETFKNQIINYLLILIPNLSRIVITPNKDRTDTEILYYEKDKEGKELQPVLFDQLAMGMRNIIGLIGDMIQRLSENKSFIVNQKEDTITLIDEPELSLHPKLSKNIFRNLSKETFNSLSELSGIVLIDEFDNHLHPKWQRELVKNLSDLFPKVQFIVSTHSPIPFLGAPKNSIFIKVDRDKEHGIRVKKLDIDISTLSPNSILTSPIFGFGSLTPEMHDGSKPVKTNSDFQKIIEAEKLDKEIEKFLTDERKKRFNNLLNSDQK